MDPYVIEINQQLRLIHLTLRGQWDIGVANEYRRGVEDAAHSMGGSNGGLRVLIDMRDQGVQSKVVADSIASMVAKFAALDNASAVVLPVSALKGMQVRRIGSTLTRNQFFADPEEARAWLLAQEVKAVF